MLSCTDCGRPLGQAEQVTCKSCISEEYNTSCWINFYFDRLNSLKCTREKLEADVSELKDAIQLAILDDPEKRSILEDNSHQLNKIASQLMKEVDEDRLELQGISDEKRKLDALKLIVLEAEHEAKAIESKRNLELLIQEQAEKQGKLENELNDATRTVAEQRRQLLDNIKLCFKMSLVQISSIDYLRILHFQIPLDCNYNRMAPDDLNAVLGHVAQIAMHMSRIFGVALPFNLVPNMPITYIRVGSDNNDRVLLWMNAQDPTGRTVSKFVTAVGLLNFCISWLASAVLPPDSVDSWNGMRNFWAIINGWTAEMPLHRPSASLVQVVRETIYSWNMHTGDAVIPSIPLERLTSIMRLHALEQSHS